MKHDYKNIGGWNACGITKSFETFLDSNECKLIQIGYYHPWGVEQTSIAKYYSDDEVVFASIVYRPDLREALRFKEHIYINDTIRIKKAVFGDRTELPTHIKKLLKKKEIDS